MQGIFYLRLSKGTGCGKFDSNNQTITIQNSGGAEDVYRLSVTESRTLTFLIANAGNAVSREEILSFSWVNRVVSNGSLNQCIFSLRNIIGDDRDHEVIQTVTRKGYKLNPEALVKEDDSSLLVDAFSPNPVVAVEHGQVPDLSFSSMSNIKINNSYVGIIGIIRYLKCQTAGLKFLIFLPLLISVAVIFIEGSLFSVYLPGSPLITTSQTADGNRIVQIGEPLDQKLVSKIKQHIAVSEMNITLILHPWDGELSVACIRAGAGAINSRIISPNDNLSSLFAFVTLCGRNDDLE